MASRTLGARLSSCFDDMKSGRYMIWDTPEICPPRPPVAYALRATQGDRWDNMQDADLGYGGPGAVPRDGPALLQKCGGGRGVLRHHGRGVVPEDEGLGGGAENERARRKACPRHRLHQGVVHLLNPPPPPPCAHSESGQVWEGRFFRRQ